MTKSELILEQFRRYANSADKMKSKIMPQYGFKNNVN